MKANLIFIAVLLCMALIMPAFAQNMSISRLGTGTMETVQIYEGTTLQGTWNTSSNGIELPEGDFLLVIKPAASTPLNDPKDWLENTVFPWVQTNAVVLVFIAILLGYWFKRS